MCAKDEFDMKGGEEIRACSSVGVARTFPAQTLLMFRPSTVARMAAKTVHSFTVSDIYRKPVSMGM